MREKIGVIGAGAWGTALAILLGEKGYNVSLWMYEQEQRHGTFKRFEVSKAIAEAKMLAPIVAFETINDVLQWFGAFGYTLDCPIEMGLRGVRSYMLAEGSTEIMKIIVARELLGKDFVAYPSNSFTNPATSPRARMTGIPASARTLSCMASV